MTVLIKHCYLPSTFVHYQASRIFLLAGNIISVNNLARMLFSCQIVWYALSWWVRDDEDKYDNDAKGDCSNDGNDDLDDNNGCFLDSFSPTSSSRDTKIVPWKIFFLKLGLILITNNDQLECGYVNLPVDIGSQLLQAWLSRGIRYFFLKWISWKSGNCMTKNLITCHLCSQIALKLPTNAVYGGKCYTWYSTH